MHHTSLDGRRFLAEAKNAAAPENKQRKLEFCDKTLMKDALCLIQIFG